MNSRKRPAQPNSRGNSPPDKRTRPSRQRSSTHNWSPDAEAYTAPSGTSASRKGSDTSLASRKGSIPGSADDVPTGTRRTNKNDGIKASSDIIPPRRSSLGQSPIHVQSPSSGSGSLTPLHGAPPAPSMLPQATARNAQASSATSQSISLATLRRLKHRKHQIANEFKGKTGDVTLNSSLAVKVKAQQMEIGQLKKEREQMSKRLEVLENLPNQVKELTKRLDSAPNHSTSIKHVIERVADLEVKVTKDHKSESIADLQSDIDKLKSWKEAESTSMDQKDDIMNSAVLREALLKIETDHSKLKTALRTTKVQLHEQVEDITESLTSLKSDSATLKTFMQNFEEQKVFTQLQDLSENLSYSTQQQQADMKTATEALEADFMEQFKITQANLKSTNEQVVSQGTIIGQVMSFQGDLSKLRTTQGKLIEGQSHAEERLDMLEKIGSSSSVVGNTSVATADERSRQHDDEVRELQKSAERGRELQQLVEKHQAVATQLTQIEIQQNLTNGHSERLDALTDSVRRSDTELATLKSGIAALGHTTAANLRKINEKLPPNVNLQDIVTQMHDIKATVEMLERDLQSVEATAHGYNNTLEELKAVGPELFNNHFDPFKAQMEQQLESFGQAMHKIHEEVTKLNQRPLQAPTQRLEDDMEKAREAITQLFEKFRFRDQELDTVKSGVTANMSMTEKRFDQLRLGFRNLQHQYNNISTDELHGKMVHWFLQHHPSNTADMLNLLTSLQQEVGGLKALSAQVFWLQERSQSQNLSMLLTDAPQLHVLAGSVDKLQQLPQKLDQIDEIFHRSKDATDRIEKQAQMIKTIDTTMEVLQISSNNLKSTTNSLEISARELQAWVVHEIANERQACVSATKELRSSADTEHDRRVADIKNLRKDVDACTAIAKKIQESSDEVQKTFIRPNRELFGMFNTMLLVVGQIQSVVESINQNLPHGPLVFDWLHDFHEFSAFQVEGGEVDDSGDKGKGRSKS
ncbi:hypothetical protein GQ44DRAFT_726427 [Phaeosphaeriaceae sp. PMI808]|nr:hypothetical protein GQ44DRAFT_726427 [Phaeosphaeriaceae sp. PMI808]